MTKIKNNIELVSLHIPKTAGTSFRNILKEQFSNKSVVRLDIYDSGVIHLDEKNYTKTELKSHVKIIHGHFKYPDLIQKFDISEDVPFITWLRDPVARVVSNYYFLLKIIADRLKEKPEENLLNRVAKSLKEFAAQEETQNVMSKFLVGLELEQFKFIGIQDSFESELERLVKTMGWEKVKNIKHNVTGKTTPPIDEETLEFIKKVNQKDIELFNRALELNDNR